jgi:hypothetical protein
MPETAREPPVFLSCHGRRGCNLGNSGKELESLLKVSLISLSLRGGHMADQIGNCRAEDKLRAVGILEPELIVADDTGAVQNPARHSSARSHGPKDVNDRRGSIGSHIIDNQRSTSIGIPRRIAPSAEKPPVGLRDGCRVSEPIADALLAKHPARLGHGRRWRWLRKNGAGNQSLQESRAAEWHDGTRNHR